MRKIFQDIECEISKFSSINLSEMDFLIRFLRPKEEGVTHEGNDRFIGYSIDLIDGISKILGFKYVFELVPDGAYGSYNKDTKKWNGLVKHLLDHVSDKI